MATTKLERTDGRIKTDGTHLIVVDMFKLLNMLFVTRFSPWVEVRPEASYHEPYLPSGGAAVRLSRGSPPAYMLYLGKMGMLRFNIG